MNVRPHLTLLAIAGTMLGATLTACSSTQQTAPAAVAQVAPGAPGAHHNPIRQALAAVTLTPAQQTQIDAFRKQARAARQAGTPEPRTQLLNQIEGILTPDQLATFKSELQRERRERHGGQAA